MVQSDTMKTTLLISSRKDPAGTLIHEELHKILENEPADASHIRHWYADERLIYLSGPDLPDDADRILFLSRHASIKPRPVLTVHVTGNFGPADYGGTPKTLTPAATELMHALINGLVRHAPEGYEVMYEATHHGPTQISLPSCFVEIGSTETEWNDRVGARAVAQAVLDALLTDLPPVISLAGFGGTHYAQRQTEISKRTRGGFGHIMPTRDIQYLTEEMFTYMVLGSKADAIYIDGKSVPGKDERFIAGLAEKFKLPVLGQGDLIRLKELPFSEYLAIQKLASAIFPGSSLVLHDLNEVKDPALCTIPGELVDEVMKIAAEEFISALDTFPLVHLTGKGKACHPSFITDREFSARISDELIHLCVTLLQDRYTCSFEGDSLIIRKLRFDPKKAGELGIPPGPLYSDLMAGKPVHSGDTVVYPAMVMTETEKRIEIPQRQGR